MKLNREQAKHLAETMRIVAIAQFGYFGYYGLIHWTTQRSQFVLSSLLFVIIELLAVALLTEEDDDGTC